MAAKKKVYKPRNEVSEKEIRKCDMCHKFSEVDGDDVVLFGEWKTSKGLNLHYFCLLLSTNLQQNGQDSGGILGFFLRDIRHEIKQAALRTCYFCLEKHASIECHKCKKYFHLMCGTSEYCLFEFHNNFISYCKECLPLNEKQQKLLKEPPPALQRCYICNDAMGPYNCTNWIFGPCCGNGFVHRICMLKFALNAGYYVRCLWCRDTKFRDLIRGYGIYIPDRDAIWERGKNYQDLHRSYKRCDMERCLCPQGRDFVSKKWVMSKCMFCGSWGAHNPICITGDVKSRALVEEFKCDTCSIAQQSIIEENLEKTLNNKSISQQLEEVDEEVPTIITASNETVFVQTDNTDSEKTLEEEISTEINRCCCNNLNANDREHAKTFEFEEKNGIINCKGSVTLCINKQDERFLGKSVEEIVTNHLFEDKDIICRSSDIGIFGIIDQILMDMPANKKYCC